LRVRDALPPKWHVTLVAIGRVLAYRVFQQETGAAECLRR
jgi:hypothetical protein